ncbi:hypothetical protein Tco_0730162 [Tanacetum coccineum]|uniref:Uncharacterized protein n=1 Tax=Tanacetum coccineum TaxID=301880 RepID=A0ABQ4YTG5_9ASTR
MATFEIAEEEGLLNFLRDRCHDLRRKNARRRMLIREMEALGERGVAVDSLESLKQTHARETAKLAALTDTIAESLAGTDKSKNHKKTVKSEQTRTRESEEFKKKPKIQSRSQKSQASVKSQSNIGQ